MGKKQRPLYSEQIKKGYVKIKIAQPSVWEYKNKWVWMKTHPDKIDSIKKGDVFIFLDGNNRNFDPANIEKLSRRELGRFNIEGGFKCKDPEKNRMRLARIRLLMAMYDKGEVLGLVAKNNKGSRAFKNKIAENARVYYAAHKDDEEFKKRHLEQVKRYKAQRTPAQIERDRKRQHEYYLKRRGGKK